MRILDSDVRRVEQTFVMEAMEVPSDSFDEMVVRLCFI